MHQLELELELQLAPRLHGHDRVVDVAVAAGARRVAVVARGSAEGQDC